MNCPEHLLALSAAGLIEAEEERQLREHARECPSCAARLESLAELASELRRMPVPAPPAYLAAQVSRQIAQQIAEDRDHREAARLAAGAALLAWMMTAAVWYLLGQLNPAAARLWVMWSIVTAAIAAPVMAGLFRRPKGAR